MTEIAHTAYWVALVASGGATLLLATAVAFHRERWLRAGTAGAAVGWGVLTLGLALRWAATGHGPYLGRYEALGSYAWAVLAFYLLLQWRLPQARAAGAVVAPAVFLLLGAGVLNPSAPQFESPAMRSVWLWIHVGMAKIALAALVLGAGAAVVYLRRERAAQVGAGPGTPPGSSLPELEELSVGMTSLGFFVLAVVIGSGALWANTAWGAYWSWDPIETWALATWVLYGGALHFHRLWGVSGVRWAWLNLATLVASVLVLLAMWLLTLSPHWIYLG